MTTEEKLQHFYTFSMDSASREAKQILDDYRAALDAQFEAHRDVKETEASRQLTDGANEVKREINKTLSNEQLNIKRVLSQKEREIRHQIFHEVQDKLIAYKSDSPAEYLDLICRKIREAQDFAAGDEMTIYIDPEDEALVGKIKEKTGIAPAVSKESFLGGMRAVIRSKNILIDNSFASLMREARSNFTLDGGMAR